MPAGRKAKPAEQKKVIQGAFGRKTPESITPVDAAPRAPEGCTPRQAELFGQLSMLLNQEQRASASHTRVIWLAARRMEEIEDLDADIKKHGRIFVSKGRYGKQVKANPAVAMRDSAQRHLQSLLAELGLTPTTYGKVPKSGGKAADNPWANHGRQ